MENNLSDIQHAHIFHFILHLILPNHRQNNFSLVVFFLIVTGCTLYVLISDSTKEQLPDTLL